ncbi:uncharacterized protein SOCE836_086000 [Sorangium cellulosum]|uniref:Uncharacterized protein n=1 Tax=Sorangium cellulosum TaxID=56 RepID=A0A4P2R334_SORCE|nr:uncharacterized protein SOCE836_086000 [Sorangium cellulosum]
MDSFVAPSHCHARQLLALLAPPRLDLLSLLANVVNRGTLGEDVTPHEQPSRYIRRFRCPKPRPIWTCG